MLRADKKYAKTENANLINNTVYQRTLLISSNGLTVSREKSKILLRRKSKNQTNKVTGPSSVKIKIKYLSYFIELLNYFIEDQ